MLNLKIIHILRSEGCTRPLLRKILKNDPLLEVIYTLSTNQISHTYKIPLKRANKFRTDLHNNNLKREIMSEIKQFKIITIIDESYPIILKTIHDPPLVLYCLGDISLLKQIPALSVIGTRKPSKDAGSKTALIVQPLASKKWVIISGMASGIDSYAHKLTLLNNGKTIAVLGSGFNHIYPSENSDLFHSIKRNGLLISEYPPNASPKPYYFPERNRIISGLSFGTLVIEAMERSGTLITVEQALDQGREVYALPGSPLELQTLGCHKMIQEGAKLVLNEQDIIEDWNSIGVHLFASYLKQ